MSGIVAAGNHYTAKAGESILAGGGNAVDAAVAATFVSFLGEIGFVHSGGSGLALLYDSRRDSCTQYDFFSAGPGLGRTSAAPKDFHKVTVSFGSARQDFNVGRASVAVPGNFFGLCRLAEDHGSLPLSRLLEPAITLAEEGVVLDFFQARTCKILEPIYTHTPALREIFCPRGHLLKEGERLRIPALAHTLQELARNGEDYLRRGGLARALLEDQLQRGGLLTQADLLGYRVEVHQALACDYKDTRVWLPSLPSSGGPLIGLALQIMACLEVPESECIPALAEVMAAVNRSRGRWEDWVDIHGQEAPSRLWNEQYIAGLVQQVSTALDEHRTRGSVPEPRGPSATTHISVIDANGLAVSLTHTAGESAGFVVPGTGFIPNNMMGEADLHPRGFHLTVPGARILTMMAPSILTSPKLGCVALGSGGSTRIRSAMLQVIHHLVDRKKSLREAVEEPRVHYESGVLQIEGGMDAGQIETAHQFGYELNLWQGRHLYFGGANAVAMDAEQSMQGCGDPRRGGFCQQVNSTRGH